MLKQYKQYAQSLTANELKNIKGGSGNDNIRPVYCRQAWDCGNWICDSSPSFAYQCIDNVCYLYSCDPA